jgi:putative hemolysin
MTNARNGCLSGNVARGLSMVLCLLSGCSSVPPSTTGSEDERGTVGATEPSSDYCVLLGYQSRGEFCIFPDGTSCNAWAFFRGQCGEPYSYCASKGGEISSRDEMVNGARYVYAECRLGEVKCKEYSFARTGMCLPE